MRVYSAYGVLLVVVLCHFALRVAGFAQTVATSLLNDPCCQMSSEGLTDRLMAWKAESLWKKLETGDSTHAGDVRTDVRTAKASKRRRREKVMDAGILDDVHE